MQTRAGRTDKSGRLGEYLATDATLVHNTTVNVSWRLTLQYAT